MGRVSVVDGRGELLLDRFVAPTRPVTDHLTDMTGIRHTLFSHYKARCIFSFQVSNIVDLQYTVVIVSGSGSRSRSRFLMTKS